MNPLRLVLALGLLSLVAHLHAVTTPAGHTDDLGQGLTYLRPTTTEKSDGTSLLKTLTTNSVVLDLRYVPSGENADAWLAAIKAFAAPKRICIVLVSPETSPALLAGLGGGLTRCITVGRNSPALGVNISVDTSAESDRQAWESIGQGKELAKLIKENADKPRYDEAVLAKEYADEVNGNAPPSADGADASSPAVKTKPTKGLIPPAPLIDAVLQRAVHIHRGLLALRKL